MRTLKQMKEHPLIADLKGDDGNWKNESIVATDKFDDQFVIYLAGDLEHLANADGSPHAEPKVIELWLGIDFPIRDSIDFRILGASAAGIWIDDGGEARIGSHAVLIPWTSLFTIHIHSEKTVKRGE